MFFSLFFVWHITGFFRNGTLAFILALLGLTIEFIQKYTPYHRKADCLDLAADFAGILIAWLGAAFIQFLNRKAKI